MKNSPAPAFPATRLRRNRKADWSRRLVSENTLSASDLIWPLFLIAGKGKREAIPSMPGVDRLSGDEQVSAAAQDVSRGLPVLAPFPPTPLAHGEPTRSLAT